MFLDDLHNMHIMLFPLVYKTVDEKIVIYYWLTVCSCWTDLGPVIQCHTIAFSKLHILKYVINWQIYSIMIIHTHHGWLSAMTHMHNAHLYGLKLFITGLSMKYVWSVWRKSISNESWDPRLLRIYSFFFLQLSPANKP